MTRVGGAVEFAGPLRSWTANVVERARLEAGFLAGTQGPLFYVLHPATVVPARGCVLYVHPFAEELNKSRRMAALQARRFAAAGYAVLMPDLYGCGDSGGDFGDARWAIWSQDLHRCLDELDRRYPEGPLMLWGLRAGCLLLGELAAARARVPAATVFWQPVVDGERFLTQFLRLRMAASMIGGRKETTAQLRARLEAGETLEVAGYALAPELAAALAAARLTPPATGSVLWLDVTSGVAGELSPAGRRLVESWRQRGIAVETAVVTGEPFWSTQEITEAPALLNVTRERLAEWG